MGRRGRFQQGDGRIRSVEEGGRIERGREDG